MALTFLQIKEYTRPDLLITIPEEKTKYLTNDKLVQAVNDIARDLNSRAEIRSEKFYRSTTASQNNYTLNGPVLKIYKVKYHVQDYLDIEWARVPKDNNGNGRIVINEDDVGGGDLLEVWYLRDTLDIDGNNTDEVDLPDEALVNFVDLVKLKILSDIGQVGQDQYDMKFIYSIQNIKSRIDRKHFIPHRPKDFWLGLTGSSSDYPEDEYLYEITKNEVGGENIAFNPATGNYYWVS